MTTRRTTAPRQRLVDLAKVVIAASVPAARLLAETALDSSTQTKTLHAKVRHACLLALEDPFATPSEVERRGMLAFLDEFPFAAPARGSHRHCVWLDTRTHETMMREVRVSGLSEGAWLGEAVRAKIATRTDQPGGSDAERSDR